MDPRFLFGDWETRLQKRSAELRLQQGRSAHGTHDLPGCRTIFSRQANGRLLSDGVQNCFGRTQRNHSAAAGEVVGRLQACLQCPSLRRAAAGLHRPTPQRAANDHLEMTTELSLTAYATANRNHGSSTAKNQITNVDEPKMWNHRPATW